ncbi:AraC family transcriptional regulator [Paenibacillus eucommiae]|uniref:AraC-like DNA-binding protein/mannose-6-phosphate isomerase-like protein (Cupin superfamily) n=1 Tax=Paenibacillus eucommiae TaxID=1355755 RepID=A0ABS4J853_9BACL|nr:AraC family transcriptional regulator [Paenibacillus eucommiae]MBP1996024.1 AraC-like DNA-binding protein/mannose-6-phosphate isomerase-like protein (cupin superfamily) [Paenibacillus eucommiae]
MSRSESYYVISNPEPDQEHELLVLFAGESQTKPVHQLGPRVYDFYLIHHIISGKGCFTCQGQERQLGAGDSFIIEPEQLVSYTSDEQEPWYYRWVAFTGPQAAKLVASTGTSPKQPIIHTGRRRQAAVLFRHMQQAFHGKKNGSHLRAIGYLHLLLAEYSAALAPASPLGDLPETESSKLIEQAVHYLSTQYAEPITIEMMAESLGYNRAYLSRLFKQHTQVTPVTFLLKLRIDKARLLLRERRELTVEQIAASVGFHDPLYFSKQFRRWYGASPTEYRRQTQS